jgi:hypothetical protein
MAPAAEARLASKLVMIPGAAAEPATIANVEASQKMLNCASDASLRKWW